MAEEQSATAQLLAKKTKAAKPAKEATATATVNKDDVLMVTAHEIENLTKEKALKMADDLLESTGLTDFRLGGVLAVIQREGWFEGYDSFRGMIEQKYGLQYRKAMYLVGIYNDLVSNQIPWDKVKGLGWTKLMVISHILTAENVDEWVAKANALTVLQLQEAVKAATQASGTTATTGDEVTSTVSTLTFKVHSDQKETVRSALDKAKAEVSTEFDTVALESICVGYLGGSVNINKTGGNDLEAAMKGHTYEEVLGMFEKVFPDVDLTVSQ